MNNSKERSQELIEQLKEVNRSLRMHGTKSVDDSLFSFFQFWLISKKCYRGYNYFRTAYYLDGTTGVVPGKPDEYDYLQFI